MYDDFLQFAKTLARKGGDILKVGSHFYIGRSGRTNLAGARQMIGILENHGFSGSMIELGEMLHLKTGVAYLENDYLLACGEMLTKVEFQGFNILPVDQDESYAANCIWVNGTVLVPEGFPKTKDLIQEAGYETLSVNVSEFRKLDGGLSCLSLRF